MAQNRRVGKGRSDRPNAFSGHLGRSVNDTPWCGNIIWVVQDLTGCLGHSCCLLPLYCSSVGGMSMVAILLGSILYHSISALHFFIDASVLCPLNLNRHDIIVLPPKFGTDGTTQDQVAILKVGAINIVAISTTSEFDERIQTTISCPPPHFIGSIIATWFG